MTKLVNVLKIPAVLLITTIVLAASLPSEAEPNTLPKLNLNIDHISVSGLSSGGYMASQFHLAYGDWVSGVGIIAAGPYYCAQNSILTALAQCVNKVESVASLSAIEQQIATWRQQKLLAPADSVQGDKVWIFHGTKDTKIHPQISQQLVEQYKAWAGDENVEYINDQPFAHHFPTPSNGTDCEQSISPFIGNCDYDAANKMLDYIAPESSPETTKPIAATGKLLSFDQQQLGGDNASSLGSTGFVYLPASCQQGASCKLHISFHGCNQNQQAIGDQYPKLTGINQWADNHNTVVLYPQTNTSTLMPMNPQGCWDWWGYTDENYATNKGQQIQAVRQMALALSGTTGAAKHD
ncbi:PHB depolymerase family esterase [Alteromonadaceae bacterium BrNp21-10]|nr:PHB depolymerase family esterase [Alteromonadaceae bacterium BrNp21-10]